MLLLCSRISKDLQQSKAGQVTTGSTDSYVIPYLCETRKKDSFLKYTSHLLNLIKIGLLFHILMSTFVASSSSEFFVISKLYKLVGLIF